MAVCALSVYTRRPRRARIADRENHDSARAEIVHLGRARRLISSSPHIVFAHVEPAVDIRRRTELDDTQDPNA